MIKKALAIVAFAALLALILAPLTVLAQDRWTGPDKQKHFVASAALGFGCKGFLFPDDDLKAWGCAMAPGVVKELTDPRPSSKDLVWNAVGAYVGVQAGGWIIRRNFIGYQRSF